MKVVWSIAGLDPSGGAGLSVDAKVFAALGVHGVAIATAVTAQGLRGCRDFEAIGAATILAQAAALDAELAPDAIKIGMLGSAEAVHAVRQILDQLPSKPFVVLDPVLGPSTGRTFSDQKTVQAIAALLLPRVDLVTPNAHEALQLPLTGATAVLRKGGHQISAGPVVDRLTHLTRQWEVRAERHAWTVRGTGCALSAAIAAFGAQGQDIINAVVAARAYVARGIRRSYPVHDSGTDAPRLLYHAAFPPEARDMPWIGVLANEPFASCGLEPLGFYPIVNCAAWVERLVPLGVRTIQLRIKELSGAALLREIVTAQSICKAFGARLFVNDHWREALEAEAYGVHLGQDDLSMADLDKIRHAGMRLGVSTHSYAEAAVARALRPSYVALGPIFHTTLKAMPFLPQGLERVAEWRALFSCPLVAIGGITLERAPAVLRQGADSIAVVSDITQNPQPERRARAWLELFANTAPGIWPKQQLR